MVGKNNKRVLDQKASQHFTRWSLRRLNVGVVSIAIASGFFMMGGLSAPVAHAETISPATAVIASDKQSVATDESAIEDEDAASDTQMDTTPSLDSTQATESTADDQTTSTESDQQADTEQAEDQKSNAQSEQSTDKSDQDKAEDAKDQESQSDKDDQSEDTTKDDQTTDDQKKDDSVTVSDDADKAIDKAVAENRAADVNVDTKEMDTETHYTATGMEDSTLRYANTVFDGVNDDGTIKLTLTKWAEGATGWGTDKNNPYAGKVLISFKRKEFYEQIGSIVIKSNLNKTEFTPEANGGLWTVPIRTTTVQSGLLGVVTNHEITITLKDGKTLADLGLDGQDIAFSTVWVKGDGAIAKESISNGVINTNNSHLAKPNSEKADTSFVGSNTGKMSDKILFDTKTNAINSVHNFKPNENFLQSNYKNVIYILEQIPKELLPYIDTNNIELGVSDISGNFTKQTYKLVMDENGLVDSSKTPEISIVNNDTMKQLNTARQNLDANVFYGALGQSRNYTIKYHLKSSVTMAEFAKALNDYITKNNKQLVFESWMEQDFLNSSKTPNIDKVDNGAPAKEIINSYANGFIEANDTDKDGLFDFIEFQEGSDIHKVDTDGDGVPDGQEFLDDNTKMTDATSYKVTAPTTTATTIDVDKNVTISGTAAKPTYKDPSDSSKTLDVTSENAGNMTVKAIKADGTVVAEAKIATKDLTTGNYTLTIPKGTLKEGETVQLITYSPDGQQTATGPTLTAVESLADKNVPEAVEQTAKQHDKVPSVESFINKDGLPQGTTYAWKGDTPSTTNAGAQTGTVVVTYPDTSTDEVTVTLNVTPVTPTVNSETVDYNGTFDLTDNINNKDTLPAGTTYKDVSKNIDTKVPGSYTGQVEVTYPNGDTETVDVPVTVKKASETYNPQGQTVNVDKNKTPDANQAIKDFNNLPQGTTITWKDPDSIDTSKSGDQKADVIVTYPDKSTDTVTVTVTVNKDQAELTDPQAVEQTVKQHDVTVPAADKFIDTTQLPEGAIVAWKDGQVPGTTTAGKQTATVVVSYKDGSNEEVSVTLNVTAVKPTVDPETVEYGGTVDLTNNVTNKDQLPAGTIFEDVSKIDTSQSGKQTGQLKVTYPNGDIETIDVDVTVQTAAEKFNPQGQTVTVDKGQTPDANQAIKDADKLPQGTKIEWTDPDKIDTSKSGDQEAEVTVTYPDKSTDTVKVPVTVNKDQAELNNPQAVEQTVKQHDVTPSADKFIDTTQLPQGTKYAWKDDKAPSTTTDGKQIGTVTVTYTDGSHEDVTVTMSVTAVTPQVSNETVEYGGTVDLTDNVTNKADLPTGTIFEDVSNIDTTQSGQKEGQLKVTYPNGDMETIKVPVTVQTAADKFDPQTTPVSVDKNKQPDPEKVVTNSKDFPQGTTITWKDPVDTSKPGDAKGQIVVKYPDGSQDIVDATVHVNPDESDLNNPTAVPQTVKQHDVVPAAEKFINATTLPEGATVSWKGAAPTTATAGEQKAVVTVNYKDGSSEDVDVVLNVTAVTPQLNKEIVEYGGTVNLEDNVTNKDQLPAGTTIKDVTPADTIDTTQPGDYKGKLEISYPDGTKQIFDVDVTVTTAADKYTPEGQTVTVDKNQTPDANNAIKDKDQLPTGTKVEWAHPDQIDTSKSGDQEAEVIVTYPDKSTDTVKVTVSVNKDLAEQNDPKGQTVTVNKGQQPKAEDAIVDADKLPENTKVEWVDTVDTSKAGDENAQVQVTYSDGSTDIVDITVHVNEDMSDQNTPQAVPQEVKQHDVTPAVENFVDVAKLPEGTKVAWKDDAPTTANAGEQKATVTVTYKDGSSEDVEVSINVTEAKPQVNAEVVEYGATVNLTDNVQNMADLPANTTVKDVTQDTIDTTKPGAYTGQLEISYPDGTKETIEVPITVNTAADKYDPQGQTVTVDKNQTPDANQAIKDKDKLPAGTTVEWKDKVDTSKSGDQEAEVVVTYPDNSKDTVKVTVTVNKDQAELNTPEGQDLNVNKNDQVNAADAIKNKDKLPQDATYEWAKPVDTSKAGTAAAQVVVTYKDGSKDTVDVNVVVAKDNSDDYTPQGQDIEAIKGQPANAGDAIANKDALPENTKYEWQTPINTDTPGEQQGTIVVEYPDGSKDTVTVKVTVKETDAQKNDPQAVEQTVKQYDVTPSADSFIDAQTLPQGATVEWKGDAPKTDTADEQKATVTVTYKDGSSEEVEVSMTVTETKPEIAQETVEYGGTVDLTDNVTNKADLPQGTTVKDVTTDKIDTTKPGTYKGQLEITYPDGTTETVEVPVMITSAADKYDPTVGPITVDKNVAPNAEDAITNKGDLPEGTKIDWKDPVDTSQPGDKQAQIEITYPDGTKDTVDVTVHVNKDLADQNDPRGKSIIAKKHSMPNAADTIANKDQLPADTKYEWENSVDTSNAGAVDAKVVVTYSDGSKDVVDVQVIIPTDDSDYFSPMPQDVTVKSNETPNASDGIANKDQLPTNTTYEWMTPVDTSTEGDKAGTIVVTYPDGSKDEVIVKVTVKQSDADKVTPQPQKITVDKGDQPNAADGIENKADLPGGSKVTWKTPVDTSKAGDTQGTIVVTYPDGSIDELTVDIHVSDMAEKFTPQGQTVTVDKGNEPDANAAIANKDELPQGTTIDWETPVDTSTSGDHQAQVEVTYPDGSKDVVDVTVTVNKDLVEQIDPQGQTVNVNEGDEPNAQDGIANKDDLPDGTKIEWEPPVDTSTPGDTQGTIVVTYPDGSKDKVTVPVHVANMAESTTPQAQDITVDKGQKPNAADGIANKADLPGGTKLSWKIPVDTSTPGDKQGQIEVFYPDGSKDVVDVTVHVNEDMSDQYDPQDQTVNVNKDEKPNAIDAIVDPDKLPEGTQIEWKDDVDTSTFGDHDAQVEVTYPDGSKDVVDVTVHVAGDAEKITPQSQDITVKPGQKPIAGDGIANKADLPGGTKLEWKTPVDTTEEGTQTGTIVVTYPDGSTDAVDVTIHVVKPDADKYTPETQDITVKPGETPDANDAITNKDKLPEGTDIHWKEPVDTTKPGDQTGKIEITYPDGSKDEVDVPVHVVNPETDADKYTPETQDITVKPGEIPDANDAITNKDKLPEGTDIHWKEPVDTTKPGDQTGKIEITYPDGSKDEVDVPVHVVNPETDADKYTPETQDITVKPGETPDANDAITNKDKLPEGTTIEWQTPVDTSTVVGDITGTIVVTYPDGSKDEVDVPVHVVNPETDADKYTPETQDITVKPGERPNASDAVTNKDKLPEGTDIHWKEPVDTTKPGDQTGKIEITYPDGSKDEVDVPVHVVNPETDADKYTPETQDITVKPGETPDANDAITNKDKLPEGTDIHWKEPVDTTKPGDQTGKIEITYPDGSKDEVDVPVHVVNPETDADKYTPETQDITVKPGERPNASDAVTNKDKLPEGTTIEWQTPVDTSTVVGDITGTIVVTYPDGSKDTADVIIHVHNPETDADKYTPETQDITIKPGERPNASDAVTNKDKLPEGTTIEWQTPVDTSTVVGDITGTIVVTYPDGSKDTADVIIHVHNPETDADKYTPEIQDITVKPGEQLNASDAVTNKGDLPGGTTIEWETPVDTTIPGKHTGTIVVTYPDGSKDMVDVTIVVEKQADNNVPGTDDQGNNGQGNNGMNSNASGKQAGQNNQMKPNADAEPMTTEERVEAMSHLPQTGATSQSAAAGWIAVIAGLFVLGGVKRRKEDD
ncbi:MAG: Rib/alpha-like domain-containing protein [Aerococcus sp.]|nr:Rib/alpha-like domain-containing protein [Aerococcus sp.]